MLGWWLSEIKLVSISACSKYTFHFYFVDFLHVKCEILKHLNYFFNLTCHLLTYGCLLKKNKNKKKLFFFGELHCLLQKYTACFISFLYPWRKGGFSAVHNKFPWKYPEGSFSQWWCHRCYHQSLGSNWATLKMITHIFTCYSRELMRNW